MEKDRELRYQSAADIRTDLQRLKRDSKTGSYPSQEVPSQSDLLQSWWRRKITLGASALVLIGMVLAATFSTSRKHSSSAVSSSMPAHEPVTHLGTATFPAISPDGKFIAYAMGLSGNEQKLMMQALSRGPSLELLRGVELGGTRWSPDGSELMVRDNDSVKGSVRTQIVPHLGGVSRTLGSRAQGRCWMPDGSQIVTATQNSEADGGGIWLVNKQTGAETRIHAPGYKWLIDLDCSAKTGMLLLITKSTENYQIWMMKPDGSEQRKLLQEEKEITSARWAPTEDALYYLRIEGETKDLLKLSIPGAPATPTLLASGLETGDYFTLTADGKQLAYSRSLSFSNLWLTEFPIHGATARVQQPITSGTRLHGDKVSHPMDAGSLM
jgi:WD40-like Beta Propeller Repeat